jgi:hypothetical protein
LFFGGIETLKIRRPDHTARPFPTKAVRSS